MHSILRFFTDFNRKNTTLIVGGVMVLALTLIAVFAPIIELHDPTLMRSVDQFIAPCAEYPFGTDNLGRCVFSRVVEGARISLVTASLVYEMLDSVGVTRDQMNKYPHEISGGQAQRVAIVRALVLEPKLLICDEPTSMLDVSVQAQIVDLLRRINSERACTMLFISHDLDVVRYLCDSVTVMDKGKVVEQGMSEQVFGNPRHEFTKSLLAAAL